MRPLLVLVAGLAFPALAAELPSIDTPLRTGLSAKGDAAVVIGAHAAASIRRTVVPDRAITAR